MTGRFRLIPLALAALLLSATSALPHTSPVRTSPPANGNVQTAPREVSILFGERVEVSSDAIIVQDANGIRVDQGDARLDGNGRIVRASLQSISAGIYTVAWRVRSVDGHTVQGKFTFRVQRQQ
jgi:methionine-rich copper-binding protein CopC